MTYPAAPPYPATNQQYYYNMREYGMELLIINPMREKHIISTMSNDTNIFNYLSRIWAEKDMNSLHRIHTILTNLSIFGLEEFCPKFLFL